MQASGTTTKANPPEQSEASDQCAFVILASKMYNDALYHYNRKPSAPPELIPQRVLEALAKEKASWKAVDIESIGRIGTFTFCTIFRL